MSEGLRFTLIAYVVAGGLMWGYALVLWVGLRNLKRRRKLDAEN